MDRGAWWATVHGVAKSQTRLSKHTHTIIGEHNKGSQFVDIQDMRYLAQRRYLESK